MATACVTHVARPWAAAVSVLKDRKPATANTTAQETAPATREKGRTTEQAMALNPAKGLGLRMEP